MSIFPSLQKNTGPTRRSNMLAVLPLLFLLLSGSAFGQALDCTENNRNGCTELSPTPPQDTVAVPPNIVLMFDDSGSMHRDYMPEGSELNHTEEGLINANNNGVYYNPAVTYTPPPMADGSSHYPAYTGMTDVPEDGFGAITTDQVNLFTFQDRNRDDDGVTINYNTFDSEGRTDYYNVDSSSDCDSLFENYNEPGRFAVDYEYSGRRDRCRIYWTDDDPPYFFQYSTGPEDGPYVVHYVAETSCTDAPEPTRCVLASDASGVAAPAGVTVGVNIANWFAYYHTRMLLAKSGLMTAMVNLNSKYRFGFGSINDNNVDGLPTARYDDKIATVVPYGDGTDASDMRSQFWTWLDGEEANNNTPLRSSLQTVGEYYETVHPWTTMPGDPGYEDGSTTEFSCRASYAILTTDGFWNGPDPAGVGDADDEDGPTYTPPAGSSYPVNGYVAAPPFSQDSPDESTLADVAMHYWSRDLNGDLDNLVAPNAKDPAFWQHMTTFTVGMGFQPVGIVPAGTTMEEIFAWAHGGDAIAGFSWPTPVSGQIENIADMAHAAVNGHGNFFSVRSPDQFAAAFASAISDISARNVAPPPATGNVSVIAVGALSFGTGYNTGDWTGAFQALKVAADGTTNGIAWDAGAQLESDFHGSGFTGREVYTIAYDGSGTPGAGFQFDAAHSDDLDASQQSGLSTPALGGGSDTLDNRIEYLLGETANEVSLYRSRTDLLGAIIRSQPLYLSYVSADYSDFWPTGSPELDADAETFSEFKTAQADRQGMAYVGANDGMLHAFNAPAPTCTTYDEDTRVCTAYDYHGGGSEAWAFVPRAVYGNLGNLTTPDFAYRPTVDETPVSYDVFFGGDQSWHTILAGGVGLGGRGVYALDVTDPTTFDAGDVLWEFDHDMAIGTSCVATFGSCQASDLGFTVGQPNVGRLANGKWVVFVSNGYFPDCSTPAIPTASQAACDAVAADAPDNGGVQYSALFVLDAESGEVLAELKTPDVTGVRSYGLSTPVLGDYDNDQIDDVAFAGDAEGNLWRFDLSDPDPSNWDVTLAYKGLANAQQPITTRPRLLSDLNGNYFMVVFGTGKFLGIGDNSDEDVQALYGVRDQGPSATSAQAYEQGNLVEQFMHELIVDGATLRCVTGAAIDTCSSTASPANAVPSNKGGWFINLELADGSGARTNAGERVVVNPGAIFATNQIVFQTLITGAEQSDPCSPSTSGAIVVLDAATGAAAGVSSLGGAPMAGARVAQVGTSGSISIIQAQGGGIGYIPGAIIPGTEPGPLAIDLPVWRRRSWSEIE